MAIHLPWPQNGAGGAPLAAPDVPGEAPGCGSTSLQGCLGAEASAAGGGDVMGKPCGNHGETMGKWDF